MEHTFQKVHPLLLLAFLVFSCTVFGQTPGQNGFMNLPAQKIGPNDLVAVSVYDAPELTRSVRVGADGRIQLPMLKHSIAAEGLLPSELGGAIRNALQQEDLILDPLVTVTVLEYFSRPISVAGAVRNPTTFQAIGNVTLLEAITRAGGLTANAGPEILVSRPIAGALEETAPARIPVKGLIDAADPALNIRLHGGEEIRVPEAGKVFAAGNVKRPGAYPFQGEPQTTVLQLVALAEGLAPFAYSRAYVYRSAKGSDARQEIAIELRKIMDRTAPDVTLQPNDILYVPDNKGRRATANALDRILGFGAATASGVLIWRR